MLLSDKPLRVFANPFAIPLSHRGLPVAFIQYDPEHASGSVRYIGATIDSSLVRKEDTFSARQSRFEKRVVYDMMPQPIVDTMYHRRLVRSGELLAADRSTARRCGLDPKAFDAAKALEAARASAVEAWRAEHDDEEPPFSSWPELRLKIDPDAAAPSTQPAPSTSTGVDTPATSEPSVSTGVDTPVRSEPAVSTEVDTPARAPISVPSAGRSSSPSTLAAPADEAPPAETVRYWTPASSS